MDCRFSASLNEERFPGVSVFAGFGVKLLAKSGGGLITKVSVAGGLIAIPKVVRSSVLLRKAPGTALTGTVRLTVKVQVSPGARDQPRS